MQDLLKNFPISKGIFQEWLAALKPEDPVFSRRIYKYLEFMNENKLLCVNYSSRLKPTPGGIQKGNLNFDYENFTIDTVGNKDVYSIEIINPHKQLFDEQCYTICHEIGHIYIGHEIRLAYKNRGENVSILWCMQQPKNIEDICDYIADILLEEKPMIL